MFAVRRAVPADVAGCVAIVRGLPDYFTEDVPAKIADLMRTHPTWVVTDDRGVVAFAIVDCRSARAAEILWMAVAAALRRGGVGTLLLDRVVGDLAEDGVQVYVAALTCTR
ncbi:GNAT family N-acetyltransferase [Nocardia sp. NPDC004278]